MLWGLREHSGSPQSCLTWQSSGCLCPFLCLPQQKMQLKPSVYVAGRGGAREGGELGMRSAGWMGQAVAVKASGLQQSGR